MGFDVEKPEDARLLDWLSNWRQIWANFRGEPWAFKSLGKANATTIFARVLKSADSEAFRNEFFMPGERQLKTTIVIDPDKDELWGFRLCLDTTPISVEVFCSESAISLPPVELMVDGCCRGAIWKCIKGRWELAELWL